MEYNLQSSNRYETGTGFSYASSRGSGCGYLNSGLKDSHLGKYASSSTSDMESILASIPVIN